ncbi:PIN domain-containing protein [bacterium CPR1]|nr:PIN domain-containing protein [bacterium CPR1]
MRALLDVNVLVALLDRAHVHHHRARSWFLGQAQSGWASCPLTQNGFVRVLSQPKYPKPISTSQAIELLESAAATDLHEFWPADVSLLDESSIHRNRVHGPKQLTDLYLLSLAVSRAGFLATFDQSIPLSAVPRAEAHHLVVI